MGHDNHFAAQIAGTDGFAWLDGMAWRATGAATGGHIRNSQRGRVPGAPPPAGVVPDTDDTITMEILEELLEGLVRRRHYLSTVRVAPPRVQGDRWVVRVVSAAPWQGPVASQGRVTGASKARALVAALATRVMVH